MIRTDNSLGNKYIEIYSIIPVLSICVNGKYFVKGIEIFENKYSEAYVIIFTLLFPYMEIFSKRIYKFPFKGINLRYIYIHHWDAIWK